MHQKENKLYQEESYERHNNWYNRQYPTDEAKIAYYEKTITAHPNSINQWLQQLFFRLLDPLLLQSGKSWLTLGDAYGFDAQYIITKNSSALASDLNTDFLKIAKQRHIISEYAAENAEALSFPDGMFDYVLCKESYHHFPRPYAAMYEMIRVARQAMVIIEPLDPVTKMPLLLLLSNLFAKKEWLLKKIWKNRFSYEPVGNFVYKVSEREFEKFAAGLNLPLVAFKRINPNFYFKGAETSPAGPYRLPYLRLRLRKWLLDILMHSGIFPGQVLSAIIFKTLPGEPVQEALKKAGYRFVKIPGNPYTER